MVNFIYVCEELISKNDILFWYFKVEVLLYQAFFTEEVECKIILL